MHIEIGDLHELHLRRHPCTDRGPRVSLGLGLLSYPIARQSRGTEFVRA